ncbi:MAG: amidohydrolase family protein, partial [Acidimicrobiia bacterium]
PTVELPDGSPAADTVVKTLMPGMWDCHSHYGVPTAAELDGLRFTPTAVYGSRATTDLGRTLDGGVTSVREVGGVGLELEPEIAAGRLRGPNLYGAGGIMSPTAGHADLHALPLDVFETYQHHSAFSQVADGVPGVLKAVRSNLRRNAKVIKICSSGGVMSEVDHWSHQQFSDDEIRAIVEEAARAERVVAAHAEGKAGIMAAIRCGVHTIEHGDALDEEAIEGMLNAQMMLVPTLWVTKILIQMPEEMPDHAYKKLEELAAMQDAGLAMAIDAGVPIATGTDIFIHGDSYGTNTREITHLVDAGMSPLAAIEAATANGPLTLGPQAPDSGQLKPGFDADVIGLDFDPIAEPHTWGDADRITHVWKAGAAAKAPGG